MAAAGSLSDGSERDSCAQDSSNDADSEASESEWAPRTSSHSHGHMSTPSSASTLTPSPTPVSSSSPSSSSSTRQCGAVEQLVTAVSKVNLTAGDAPASTHCSPEEQGDAHTRDNLHHQHRQGAFQALSHSYTPSSKECSIQSCLHQFTSVELLMGNNKLLCENCTERRQKQLRKSSSAGKNKTSPTSVQRVVSLEWIDMLQFYYKIPNYSQLRFILLTDLPPECVLRMFQTFGCIHSCPLTP